MHKPLRPVLSLESLEDRWVPATVHFDGSNLSISNLTNVGGKSNLAVTQQANGSFQVTDNGTNNGAYFVTGNITITGGATSDNITVTLNKTATSLPGSLNINTGNGNDTVTLTTTAAGGTIGGNVTVNFGNGADLFAADPTGSASVALSIGGSVGVTFQTGVAQLNTGAFPGIAAHSYFEINQKTSPGQSTTIGSSVSVTGADVANLGASTLPDGGGALSVGTNATIQTGSGSAAFADANVSGSPTTQYNDFVALGVKARVGGTVGITSTTGSTYAEINSNIGGSLNANLGSGVTSGATANAAVGSVLDLNFNTAPNLGAPMTIGKDVNYTAGNGNNTLLFDDNFSTPPEPLQVGGNITVNFGNGSNSVTFANTGVLGGDVFINGSFSLRAGNGNNQIGTQANPFLASVMSNESFNVGSGNNTVALGTAPSGTVSFYGGNGTDVFSLDNAPSNGTTPQFYTFFAQFGNGANTFAISDNGGGGTTASGTAVGGSGGNTFQQNGDAQTGSPFNLYNF